MSKERNAECGGDTDERQNLTDVVGQPPEANTGHTKGGISRKIKLVGLLFLVFFLLGVALLVIPGAVRSPHNAEVLVYENTIAAVEDFPTFHVKKIFIYQNPEQQEGEHIMEILLAEQNCDDLPSYVLSSKSQSLSPPPNKTLYLLKGSELRYNICAATNKSGESGAFMIFYIVRGLLDIEGGSKPQNHFHHYALHFGYSRTLPNDTMPNRFWKCHDIQYTTDNNGYYSTLLFPSHIPSEDVKVWHETDNSYKLIDSHSLPAFCIDSETHLKEETCDITIQDSMHALVGKHQCAVVDVRNKVYMQDTSNFTQVAIHFSYRHVGQNACYIAGSLLLLPLVIFSIILIILCTCCKKRCFR